MRVPDTGSDVRDLVYGSILFHSPHSIIIHWVHHYSLGRLFVPGYVSDPHGAGLHMRLVFHSPPRRSTPLGLVPCIISPTSHDYSPGYHDKTHINSFNARLDTFGEYGNLPLDSSRFINDFAELYGHPCPQRPPRVRSHLLAHRSPLCYCEGTCVPLP